jgi:transglutaminase-like putative cysteine protease
MKTEPGKKQKKTKERKPAEDSVFLRMLWLAQTMICIWLISLADPHGSTFDIGQIKIPMLVGYFWIAIFGSYLSYHYRHKEVKWLEWMGLSVIAWACYCFIENLRIQAGMDGDIDLLTPTAHLVAGLYVSHSFELRARFDFNFSLILGLLLVFATATMGKGWVFGIGIFSYVILSAVLLLLDCESRTFGAVQARKFDELDPYMSFSAPQSEKTANLIFPTAILLAVSIGFFLIVPRAESLADHVTARIYSMVKKHRDQQNGAKESHSEALAKRIRAPYQKNKNRQHYEPKPEHNGGSDESNKASDEKDPAKKDSSSKSHNNNTNAITKSADGKNTSGKDKSDKKTGGKEKNDFKRQSIDFKSLSRTERKKRSEEREQAGDVNVDASSGLSNALNPDKSKKPGTNLLGANQEKNSDKAKSPSKQNNGKSANGSNADPTRKGDPSKANAAKNESASNKPTDPNKPVDPNKPTDPNKSNNSASGSTGQQTPNKQDSSGPNQNDSRTNNTTTSGTKSQANQQSKPTVPPPKPEKEMRYDISDEMDSQQAASQRDELIFTVTSNRTVYFRQAAFDYYDGKNWRISHDLSRADLPRVQKNVYSLQNAFPLALPDSVPAIRLQQKYHMLKNLGDKIVISGNPADITFPGPGISLDSCGNLRGQWALVKGIEYGVISDQAMYDLADMRDASVPSETEEDKYRKNLEAFLQLPDSQSQDLMDLAEKTAGLQDNWFVQAEKLCNHLRKNYKYTLDPTAKASNSPNGVDRFLFETQKGDCKDFASAFVVLCRSVGIPARMVFGYNPGDFDPASGTRQIRPKHAHAWGEVYIPDFGWVPFDATPDGTMPAPVKEEERYFTTLKEQVEQTLKKVEISSGSDEHRGPNNPNGKTVITNDPRDGKDPRKGSTTLVQQQQVQTAQKVNKWPSFTINLWDILKLIPIGIGLAVLAGPILLFAKDVLKTIKLPRKIHPASKVLNSMQKDFKSFDIKGDDYTTAGEFLDKLRSKLDENESINVDPELDASVEDFVNTYNAVFFGQRGKLKELEQKRQKIKKLLRR